MQVAIPDGGAHSSAVHKNKSNVQPNWNKTMYLRGIFLVATEASVILMGVALALPFHPAYEGMLDTYADQMPSPFLKWSVLAHLIAVFGYAIFGTDEAA